MFGPTTFLKSSPFLSLKACQAAVSFAFRVASSGAAYDATELANNSATARVRYFFMGNARELASNESNPSIARNVSQHGGNLSMQSGASTQRRGYITSGRS